MAVLIYRNREEFLATLEPEAQSEPVAPVITQEVAPQPPKATAAPVAIKPLAAPKAAPVQPEAAARKPQTQKAHGRTPVRCVECAHLTKDRSCLANGWEPTRPTGTRLCWDFVALIG